MLKYIRILLSLLILFYTLTYTLFGFGQNNYSKNDFIDFSNYFITDSFPKCFNANTLIELNNRSSHEFLTKNPVLSDFFIDKYIENLDYCYYINNFFQRKYIPYIKITINQNIEAFICATSRVIKNPYVNDRDEYNLYLITYSLIDSTRISKLLIGKYVFNYYQTKAEINKEGKIIIETAENDDTRDINLSNKINNVTHADLIINKLEYQILENGKIEYVYKNTPKKVKGTLEIKDMKTDVFTYYP